MGYLKKGFEDTIQDIFVELDNITNIDDIEIKNKNI